MTTVRRPAVDSRRHLSTTLLIALVAACSGGPTPAPTSFAPPPPAPTAKPWTLTTDISGDTTAILGGTFDITVTVTNTGRAANPATSVQVNGLADHADLATCSPGCSTSGFLGASYGTFAGIPAGGQATVTLTFQTTKLGKISPFVCAYDGAPGDGERVGDCGQGSVVIGG